MGITVQFESYEEMIGFANKLVGGNVKIATVESVKKQKATKTEEPAKEEGTPSYDEIIPDQQQIEEENAPGGEETKAYELEEVRAALAVLTRTGKQKQVKDLLTYFKAKNLTSVDPKDYAELMEKAGAL